MPPCCCHPLAHPVGSLCVAIWLVYLALIQTSQACARQPRGQVAESRRLRVLDTDRMAGRSGDEHLPYQAAASARERLTKTIVDFSVECVAGIHSR